MINENDEATAYRNGRDWANEQRDERISRANQRVGEVQLGVPTVDVSLEEATSFESEITLGGPSSIERLSRRSQPLSNEDSSTTITLQNSPLPSKEATLHHQLPLKRSNRASIQPQQFRRRQRIAGDSDYNGFGE